MNDTANTTSGPHAPRPEWEVQQLAYEQLGAELQSCNKAALFDALAASGITSVTVSFDGYGDSGQIEDITAQAGDEIVALPDGQIETTTAVRGQAEPHRQMTSTRDVIETRVYDLLAETHGGWPNDEGAYGDFYFDVTRRTITLDYTERFTTTENHTHTF